MGNHRFRFSSIIPNSWFYTSGNKPKHKLTKTQPITTSSSSSSSSSFPSTQPADYQRKSYYFTRELTVPDPVINPPDPPRKSSKKKRPNSPKKTIRRKSVSPELRCSCRRITPESGSMESNSDTDVVSCEQLINCACKTNALCDETYAKVDLPRIITKPAKEDEFGSAKWVIDGTRSLSVRVVREGITGISTTSTTHTRSPGRKVKGSGYSPRIGNRVRVNGINGGRRRNGTRRSLSESTAVVKTSVDPGRDFKESMVEMIVENNIKSSKDLEDLLACYLSLNSDEYHDLIIKVFKQIWFESTNIRL